MRKSLCCSCLALVSIFQHASGVAAADRDIRFQPPARFAAQPGQKVVFTADSQIGFVIVESEDLPGDSKLISFHADSGETIDQLDVPELFLSGATLSYEPVTNQLAFLGSVGVDGRDTAIYLIQTDSAGRFLNKVPALLSPHPGGFSISGPTPPPVFFQSGRVVVQASWRLGIPPAESQTSLEVVAVESTTLIQELDLRPALTGVISVMATHPDTNQVAVIIRGFFIEEPAIVALCTLSESGSLQLDRVIRPDATLLADLKFDPTGRFLFVVSQERNAKVFVIDVAAGAVVQTRQLPLEVILPSVSVDTLQVNAVTKTVGVIGKKTVAFMQFDSNGSLSEPVVLDPSRKYDFEDSDFHLLPGGFHAIALDFKTDSMHLIDAQTGGIFDSIPIVFRVPASLAPDGTIAVTDHLTFTTHLYTLDLRPQIFFVEAKKKITIFGGRILKGAIVEIDGTAVPATLSKNQLMFTVKRSVAKGQTVMVEIVNPDGSRSGKVPVTR